MTDVKYLFKNMIPIGLVFLSSCEEPLSCDQKTAERKAIQYVDSEFRPDTSKVFKHSVGADRNSFKFTFENKKPSVGGAISVVIRKSDCEVQDLKITQ